MTRMTRIRPAELVGPVVVLPQCVRGKDGKRERSRLWVESGSPGREAGPPWKAGKGPVDSGRRETRRRARWSGREAKQAAEPALIGLEGPATWARNRLFQSNYISGFIMTASMLQPEIMDELWMVP
jgi:hypothetical protein